MHLKEAEDGDPVKRIRREVDRVLDRLDIGNAVREVEDLGRERPAVLAFVAVTIGLASGLLIRDTLLRENRQRRENRRPG